MSSERSGNRATAWMLVILAVPALYVLSVPPVVYLVEWKVQPGGSRQQVPPDWVVNYTTPYAWLYDTPLEQPLRAYTNWWISVLREK